MQRQKKKEEGKPLKCRQKPQCPFKPKTHFQRAICRVVGVACACFHAYVVMRVVCEIPEEVPYCLELNAEYSGLTGLT